MKNKIRKIIEGFLISLFVMVFAIPLQVRGTQIGNDKTVNVVLRKEGGSDNQVHVSLETTNTQSIASFQLELEAKTIDIQDITGVTIQWDNAIIEQAELKELTYNNGKINLYVVSKSELGEEDTHQRRIAIGTITIETQEKNNIDVILKANNENVKLASIRHELTNITNQSTEIVLRINEKANNEGDQGNNNQEDDNQTENGSQDGDENQSGNNNQGANGTQNGNNNVEQNDGNNPLQAENQIQEDIQEEGNTMLNQNTTITTSGRPIDKATGSLPQTGGTINGLIVFILLMIIILIAIVMYRKWKNAKH